MRAAGTPSPVAPQRGRPPTAGLRNAILRNAEASFTGRDFHAVAMDDIARRCGVGKGTLYRYFESKDALFHSVMLEGLAELAGQIRAVAAAESAPPAKLAAIVRSILRHFAARPGLAGLVDREERKRGAAARRWFGRRAELARLVAGVIDDGVRTGQFRAIEPRLAAEMLLGMLRAMNRYPAARESLATVERAVLDVFLEGVAARGRGRMRARAAARTSARRAAAHPARRRRQ
ncbi:MAG TPA: TetR/AcrR family transcriptional regulator [Candidatus Binatia bacterium]|nr:TetR/AcrR family transcriptional regulator [Candidatus Binatia bacterium]